MDDQSPIITLPDNKILIARLLLKLEEYRKRINDNPYRAPELQMLNNFKFDVLE